MTVFACVQRIVSAGVDVRIAFEKTKNPYFGVYWFWSSEIYEINKHLNFEFGI